MGGVSIMVWASISAEGKSNLVFIDGNINANKYINILDKNPIPKIGSNAIFQQDKATSHTAYVTKTFLNEKNIAVLT